MTKVGGSCILALAAESMIEPDAGLDPRIIGEWRTVQGERWKITPDGWLSISGAHEFSISPDGMTLNYGKPDDLYRRIYGSGNSVLGVWRAPGPSNPGQSPEEYQFREDGTYTNHYIESGSPAENDNGTYRVNGSSLWLSSPRALLATGPNNTILICRVGTPPRAETYALSEGGKRLRINYGTEVWDFTRGPAGELEHD